MFENALQEKDLLPAHYESLEAWPMPAAWFLATGELLYANQLYAQNFQHDLGRIIVQKLNIQPSDAVGLAPFGHSERDKHFWLTLKVHRSPLSHLQRVLVCGTDITHLREVELNLLRHNQELQKQAEIDHLTEVYNKRSFDMHMQQWQEQVDQGKLNVFSMIMLDLDNFKRMNDEHGHALGDEVLSLTAYLLRAEIHAYAEGHIYRLGGDEFVIALPNVDLMQANLLSQRCCDLIASSSSQLAGILQLTLSCGVATYGLHHSLNDILKLADQALYHAKNNGKNCTVVIKDGKMQVFRAEL